MAVNVNGGPLEFSAVINAAQFNAAISAMEKRLEGLTHKAEDEAKSVESLVKKTTQAIAAYASFSTATNFIKDVVRVRGEFQQLEVAFNTMLGSKEKADRLLAEATELAAKTPFTLQDVGNGAKQLLAYGFAAEEITDNLRRLGDISSGVGAPLGDIVYLYGTLRTQGRAYGKDINQFTGRGIPIIRELAKQFGVAEKEVMGLVEAGKVGFPEVEKAFNDLTSSGGMFFNLMEAQSKTLTGQISNLEDAWDRMLNSIGQSNEGIFNAALQGAISLVENYEEVLKILEVLVIMYGSYRAAIIATNVAQAVATAATKGYTVAETLRYQAMLLSEKAMKLLNATMLSNPFVLVATALAGLIAYLVIFRKEVEQVNAIEQRIASVRDQAAKAIVREKLELEGLVRTAKDEKQSKAARLDAIAKLNKISPEYLGSLTLENIKTQEATKAVDNYIKALGRKAKAQAIENRLVEIEKEQMDAENETRKLSNDLLRGRTKAQQEDFIKRNVIFKKYQNDLAKSTQEREREKQRLNDELKNDINSASQETPDATIQRTVNVIKEEIKALEERRDAVSKTSAEYKVFTAQLKKLQAELDAITGGKSEKELNDRLKKQAEDLRQLLEEITKAESDVRRDAMAKEDAELDRIQAKYDELRKKVIELKLPGDQQTGILKRIDNIQGADETNRRREKEAEIYKQYLEDQKQLFDDFEQYKLDVGVAQAQKLTEYQTASYANFVDFLKSELDRLANDPTAIKKREALAGIITDAEKEQRRRELEATVERQRQVIEKTQTFNSRRKALETQYQKELLTLQQVYSGKEFEARKKVLDKIYGQSLDELANEAYQQIADDYQKQMDQIEGVDRASTKKRIEILKGFLFLLEQMGAQQSELYRTLKKELDGLNKTSDGQALQNFQMYAQLAGQLGDAFSEANGALSDMGQLLAGAASQANNLSTAFSSTASKQDKISAGIQGVVNLVAIVIQSAKARKEAEEAYYQSVIQQQHEYNLLLNEQIGLQAEASDNVFVKDYENQIRSAYEKLADANKMYQESLAALIDGRAKLGQRNAVDWGAVGRGVGSGAAAGAAIGSIIPVIGTVIGGAVGAIVGGIVGFFGGKKKKDEFGSLLQEYPELIQQSVNGVEELNVELAQTLISQNLVDDTTKQLLQNTIDWTEQIKEAREQMEGVISDLAGSLGSSLKDALVGAFQSGEDAAKAFKETVSKSLEDVLSQIIFSNVFGSAFDKLQEEMLGSFDMGGDGQWIDDFGRFFENANGLTADFYAALEEAKKAAGAVGLDVFGSTDPANEQNGITGGVKNISEDTAGVIAGRLGGIQVSAAEQLKMAQANLQVLQNIEFNTYRLVPMLELLQDWNLNGLKVR